MDQLHALLIGALGVLSSVIVFLYFDKRGEAKAHAAAMKAKDESTAASTKDRDERFTTVIKEATKLHQEQEEEIHRRHEKALAEMVSDHKKEMSGMVDRAIEAFKNDKEHDREERGRILALAESLERRTRSGREGR